MKVTVVVEVRSLKALQGGVLLVLVDGREIWFNETVTVSCEVSDEDRIRGEHEQQQPDDREGSGGVERGRVLD
jgi:hypothetical protein